MLEAQKHGINKYNMQKIKNKRLNLRIQIKRLVQKTISFSKMTTMHDIVIEFFINHYKFGVTI